MENKLLPIYALRIKLLEKINPEFFIKNADMIKRTSLAAQDYVLSGTYKEYNRSMGRTFKILPGYINVHKKYNLPYSPDTSALIPDMPLNPGLVMDLAWSLTTDKTNGIVDANGALKDVYQMPESEVLRVYHNSSASGTPINALYLMTITQVQTLLENLNQNTK